MRTKTWLTAALLAGAVVAMVAVVPRSEAQYRWVSVNGQVLSPQKLIRGK
jgi:hypothetical protein